MRFARHVSDRVSTSIFVDLLGEYSTSCPYHRTLSAAVEPAVLEPCMKRLC